MTALILNLSSLIDKISDLDLEILSRDNPDARLEINSAGQLVFMPPTDSESGKKNSSLLAQIWYWNNQNKLGEVFDSSTGFKLSNGAVRSPDVSWVNLAKWNALTKQQRRKFAPIDPDFVLELMSPTDDLDELRNKMREYISCGVSLGWLINPDKRQVEIYRGRPRADERRKGTRPKEKQKEVVENLSTLSGEDIMSGLVIDFSEIFD